MRALAFIASLLLILGTLLDGFETILLPRRVSHRFRYSRLYYRGAWAICRRAAGFIPRRKWREAALGIFGPLSMLCLFGSWVICLILGFGLLFWSVGSHLVSHFQSSGPGPFLDCLYMSGTTFFTLGPGDVSPLGGVARTLTVIEAGLGLGFLAILISYLPVLYQAFSRREVTISLLDARAASPPGGGEFLLRLARAGRLADADGMLREWEQWSAELLESHLSFPVLAYYRSQHANQSWLAALATMLDACALLLSSLPRTDPYQAQLTFAMARHAAVDIALIFNVRPQPAPTDRFPPEARLGLVAHLRSAGIEPVETAEGNQRFNDLRGMYEPFLAALSAHFMLALPVMIAPESSADNWQRSAWMPHTPGIGSLPAGKTDRDHFD